ncbi:MAG: 5-formyltetrahydrofolate cyclo-ligase [Desulfuromonadales bacterium]|nr:MAG: 5-formyltetrahydrofolate cyclo-ligase [Desulfuromonadales bacterium]
MPKKRLRQLMLAQRRALGADAVRAASQRVQDSFLASSEFSLSRVIALYAPIHGEVGTSSVMNTALAHGKVVLFPAVCGQELRFIKVPDVSMLRTGCFGILEPCVTGEVVSPDEADVIIIPGVAFDLCGRRIGYGKGYYDRALHHLEGTGRLIGFCYDFQVVDEIAGEPHDVALDLIFTDARVIRPRGYHIPEEVQRR